MLSLRRGLIPFLLLFAAAALSAQSPAPPPDTDALARHAIDVLGGPSWDKARYFAYTLNVDRNGARSGSFPQRWDRFTGDYRVSGRDQQGREFLVVMNTKTKQGKGFLNGVEATGKDLEALLDLGFRRYNNDTYWLLMPFKLTDPGGHRTEQGERHQDDHTYDVVRVAFDAGDQYWAWINRENGVVEQWEMKLQGAREEDPPVTVRFLDFKRPGGMMISTRREVVGKNQTVSLDDLQVAAVVPKDAFVVPKDASPSPAKP